MLDSRETSLGLSPDRTGSRSATSASKSTAGSPSRSRDCLGAYLAAISKIKLLDREKEVFTGPNADAANKHLSRDYREEFGLTEKV